MLKVNTNLRETLRELEKKYQLRIWLDRRIDPDRTFDFKIQGTSLEVAIEKLAELADAESGWIENILYFGPRGEVPKIEAAFWRLYQSWPVTGRKFEIDIQWNELATPNDILLDYIQRLDLEIDAAQKLPHDLWGAGQLEKCSAPCKLTLLLAGFDRTARLSQKKLVLEKVPDDLKVSAQMIMKESIDSKLQGTWRQKWPTASIKKSGKDSWHVVGPAKAHRELFHPSKGLARNSSGKVLSGSVEGILGKLLLDLNNQSQLNLVIDPWPLPQEWSNRKVTVTFENLTIEQIFGKIGQAAGLKIERSGEQLLVREP